MSNQTQLATVLPESTCWDLLSSVSLGRLITSVDGEPEVFPVNFAVQDRTLLFRTAGGTKLVSTAINHNVTFEADGHEHTQGWSVIVKGFARILSTDDEIDVAEQAGLRPWVDADKQHFVRIRPLRVSGRRFQFDRPASAPRDESSSAPAGHPRWRPPLPRRLGPDSLRDV
ncbi:pyridoxamine 5'-phosphate oxidase [Mycobacterium sp. MS1601]|uniref:pyridoxamine 5'-phosphate oxidase family protein n=1 Tax=Mycobacterium sp. MS1601 TaxID=1936029 RepID=UPI0009792D95|nr:pyridoxamine 5'-phosphate oxidase family protein [Mycobacterium sp. MS1601]AQA05120.1 pyridoxamine 5'-phosphate oxidase [Mycobacterium sp. MS1601]